MKPKPLRLTRQAEATLYDIAVWTIETFGVRQAEVYRDEIIACCTEIASGRVPGQSCRALLDENLPEDVRFVRVGQHFVVFAELGNSVVVLDFLHVRSDLPTRIANLSNARKPD